MTGATQCNDSIDGANPFPPLFRLFGDTPRRPLHDCSRRRFQGESDPQPVLRQGIAQAEIYLPASLIC